VLVQRRRSLASLPPDPCICRFEPRRGRCDDSEGREATSRCRAPVQAARRKRGANGSSGKYRTTSIGEESERSKRTSYEPIPVTSNSACIQDCGPDPSAWRALAGHVTPDLCAALAASSGRCPPTLSVAAKAEQRVFSPRRDERGCTTIGTDVGRDEYEGHGGSLEASHYDVPGTNVGDHALGGETRWGSRYEAASALSPGIVPTRLSDDDERRQAMTSVSPSRKTVGMNGPLAQLAELRTFNPSVVGSSPTGPTMTRSFRFCNAR
jgi:hypothetical protein